MKIRGTLMTTATINMELDADTASLYTEAPAEDRNKLCILWGVILREYAMAPTPLRKLMSELSAKAKARGLTPEELDSILNEE
mgnify:CR=1 FL=1